MTKRVLVLGATGYIGGRLVPLLLHHGYKVRAAGRSLEKITSRPWGTHPRLEPVVADVLDKASLLEALKDCDTAYYLVHSMVRKGAHDFSEADREAAYAMVEASNQTGLRRIIYMGGLGEKSADVHLSHHLLSRAEVGRILALGKAKCTTLRAAMVLGSGSASFEILRYLCERLPIMLTPRWVNTRCQPISIRNVLGYLHGCLENEETAGRTLDIGGPDILTYGELFRLYGKEAGLSGPKLIPVPFMTPGLSSHWVNLITPIPMGLIQPLVDGLRNEVVCRNNDIREMIPQELVSCAEAIRKAREKTRQMVVDTHCFDVGNACYPEWGSADDAPYAGGSVYRMAYRARLQGSVERIWDIVQSIGGEHGWYYGDPLWELRGFIDKLLAGPGLKRGRKDPTTARIGDALDFWRIIDVRDRERLLLKAEMRLPGEALLEFKLVPQWENVVDLKMTASFLPKGLGGMAYWYAMYPFHVIMFHNMLDNMATAAKVHLFEKAHRVDPDE